MESQITHPHIPVQLKYSLSELRPLSGVVYFPPYREETLPVFVMVNSPRAWNLMKSSSENQGRKLETLQAEAGSGSVEISLAGPFAQGLLCSSEN